MIFCPKCGAILMPKRRSNKTYLHCSCGYSDRERKSVLIKEKSFIDKKKVEVVEKEIETSPKTKEECPKCNHKEAYYWLVQTRAGDEAETRFFRCTKCNAIWRSYS